MRIDLHAHSTASDGTSSPAELMAEAAAAGLDVVAITDHDTTAGWAAAAEARPAGLTLVPGAELSCRWYGAPGHMRRTAREAAQDGPSSAPIALHLLAYLFDPDHPDLVEALAGVRAGREARAERMVELMRADGLDVTWAEVLADAKGGTVGRPHLAQALIRRGLVATVAEAFAPQWLGQKYRLPKEDLDVFVALDLVRRAGGVAVFAHPRATVRGRIVPDELIVEMAGAGLFGLEADHTDHTDEQRAHVRHLAADLGVVVTGSSDYHGHNKTVRLGACTTDPEVYAAIVAHASGTGPRA